QVGSPNRGTWPFESAATPVMVPMFWSPNATISSPGPAGVSETVVRSPSESWTPAAVLEVSKGSEAAPATSRKMKLPPTLGAASVSVTVSDDDVAASAADHMSGGPPPPLLSGLPGTCTDACEGLLSIDETTPDASSAAPVGPPAMIRFPEDGNWRFMTVPASGLRWLCWTRTM